MTPAEQLQRDPELRAAVRLIADELGAVPRPLSGDRYRLITREPEGLLRVTVASRRALLFIAARIAAHRDRWERAHFYERWNLSERFKL